MALGAGCTVILRPAEQSPESAASLVHSCLAAGVPKGAVALLMGPPDVTVEPFMTDPGIRAISFTGSTAVGKHLIRESATTVKRLVLELGGHAPFLVLKGADIEAAAAAAVASKFRNAGQVYTSPTRFYVEQSSRDDFVDAFLAGARKLVLGHGLEPQVTMGPLSVRHHWERTEDLVTDAVMHGAQLVQVAADRQNSIADISLNQPFSPNVPSTARALTEEPFAPIALINRFDTVQEALDLANRNEAGLAGYVFEPAGTSLKESSPNWKSA